MDKQNIICSKDTLIASSPSSKMIKRSCTISALGIAISSFIRARLVLRHKIVNKKLLKKFKGSGFFIYGRLDDTFFKKTTSIPNSCFLMIGKNAFFPIMSDLFKGEYLLPFQNEKNDSFDIYNAIECGILKKQCVLICSPEPLNDEHFTYPLSFDVPTFSFTNTYQKGRFSKKPRLVTYIDGPFYPNTSLSQQMQKKHLYEQVYECITYRAKEGSLTN